MAYKLDYRRSEAEAKRERDEAETKVTHESEMICKIVKSGRFIWLVGLLKKSAT